MADEAYYLTANDVMTLKEIARGFYGDRVNTQNRTRDDSQWSADQGATQSLVAKVPAGGIPIMSGTTPGSAYCKAYQRNNSTGQLIPVGSSLDTEYLLVKVLNLTTTVIAAGSYVPVVKERFGNNWLPAASGGGSSLTSSGASVNLPGGQAITGNGIGFGFGFVTLNFGTSHTDTGGYYTAGHNYFTVPTDGWYIGGVTSGIAGSTTLGTAVNPLDQVVLTGSTNTIGIPIVTIGTQSFFPPGGVSIVLANLISVAGAVFMHAGDAMQFVIATNIIAMPPGRMNTVDGTAWITQIK